MTTSIARLLRQRSSKLGFCAAARDAAQFKGLAKLGLEEFSSAGLVVEGMESTLNKQQLAQVSRVVKVYLNN